jgi:hypothetical protein|tara:strand:+ start:502 stop:831 length:330 start_codon:yes stop_codon:yes gene_type:complete
MSITSKVRQSVILAADGQVQALVGGSAANITKANIMTVFAQSSAADGEIKLYNEIGSGVTASKLIFHGKFGTAANHVHEFKLPGAGIYADTGIYADLTNVDFFYIVGTF